MPIPKEIEPNHNILTANQKSQTVKMKPENALQEPKICVASHPGSTSRRKMKCARSILFQIPILLIVGYAPTVQPFVIEPRSTVHEFKTSCSTRSRCRRRNFTTKHKTASKRPGERVKLCFSPDPNGNNNGDSNEYNYSGFGNGNYLDKISRDPYQSASESSWQPLERDDSLEPPPPRATPNPDRAISIVSELKANAALFAAFAYGSLNLPSTLTVSESKVTSVTTSLSISRPLPDSDLIRTFVVLDVCTLCLMISCVAASQLLIYRLTDGSYEEVDENYESSEAKNSRDSALGRLVTTYRNEFTVARLTFDLGLVSLLLAVGVRSLAIFDEDIVVPIVTVIGITAVFLAVAYFTTYIEVFRTAENLKGPLYSLSFPFLSQNDQDSTVSDAETTIPTTDPDGSINSIASRLFVPVSIVSVGLAAYFALFGSAFTESNLSRLGPYAVTSGANKLKVVAEMVDSDRAKEKQQRISDDKAKARAMKKNAAEAKKKAEEEAKKKADDEARKKAEEEINKRLEKEARSKRAEEEAAAAAKKEEFNKRLEQEARKKAEEEAAAASAAAQARVEAAMKKAQEEAAAATSAGTTSS